MKSDLTSRFGCDFQQCNCPYQWNFDNVYRISKPGFELRNIWIWEAISTRFLIINEPGAPNHSRFCLPHAQIFASFNIFINIGSRGHKAKF